MGGGLALAVIGKKISVHYINCCSRMVMAMVMAAKRELSLTLEIVYEYAL